MFHTDHVIVYICFIHVALRGGSCEGGQGEGELEAGGLC